MTTISNWKFIEKCTTCWCIYDYRVAHVCKPANLQGVTK